MSRPGCTHVSSSTFRKNFARTWAEAHASAASIFSPSRSYPSGAARRTMSPSMRGLTWPELRGPIWPTADTPLFSPPPTKKP